jgi:predicted nucleotidyltransferase
MARGTHAAYLRGEEVRHKKYFYALRPLLAMQWIEQGRGMAPTGFHVLLEGLALDQVLHAAIERLLVDKCAGTELAGGPPVPALSGFIEQELDRWQRQGIATHHQPVETRDMLDSLFRESLVEAWR